MSRKPRFGGWPSRENDLSKVKDGGLANTNLGPYKRTQEGRRKGEKKGTEKGT